jgi:guanine deaminase
MEQHLKFLKVTLELAAKNATEGQGGPFAAIIVREGQIISQATNEVTSSFDPTAHAEVQAIRRACEKLQSFQLEDCILYTSCEPCPMCLGAIYWARPKEVFFAATRWDAAKGGFDDDFIYQEIPLAPEKRKIPFRHLPHAESFMPFERWLSNSKRVDY